MTHKIELEGVVTVKESVTLRMSEAGRRKWSVQRIVGDHYEKSTGLWRRIDWLIGRANDWCSKRITDPNTNAVVYEQHHRLSEHRGRGSAKHSAA